MSKTIGSRKCDSGKCYLQLWDYPFGSSQWETHPSYSCSILCDAGNSKARGSTSDSTTSSFGHGRCLFKDGPHSHPSNFVKHYKDDEGTNELSFQEWTQQMKDMLEARKRGDLTFRDKDFRSAMDCHSQVCILQ
ncbi:hypothetical protein Pyn_34541 [Prunus yedoensis var. nudiflora]|uniref:Serine/threonine-protein kinase BSK1-like TPR repeats domain-containing protein n=1 Tax=Prunus yedoensis var. nudiflora TaxID=2094558 RepID=A0A314YIH8_PRUYE|nr:hypothetical protein Pyn_34541 [Prunus yedoensis var. nudiflora]